MQENKKLPNTLLPRSAIWILCIQVYYYLLRYHKGKIKNGGNLKRAAQQCNIPNPLQLTILEIHHRLEACKKEFNFYQEHGRRFCQKHLEERKRIAQDQDNKEGFSKISTIIQQEQQRNF
jgi:hypothetical protein